MSKRRAQKSNSLGGGCCAVQAMVRIDDRGQMVLPKDVRERAGLRGGDRLALTTIEKNGRICCLVLSPADELGVAVRGMLYEATGEEEDQ